ncbi:flagellar L-ring protein FlgH [Hyphomonas hirschiana VP5]|nr:flagellar basal body L-ring protein FlgH [Hyphomonas neptunium]KCZ95417.1 flagellar L-ring protein FlgH [Hyphomonas hirschiana VP5]
MKTFFSMPLVALAAAACASSSQPVPDFDPPVPYAGYPGAVPEPVDPNIQNASLWETAPTALLSMRRAKEVGDLLTVVVEMNDQASLQSSLSRNRDSSDDMNVEALFGLPEWANGVLPGGASLSPGVDVSRNSSQNGSGAVNRAEKVTFTLAARVIGVEPNGNLIIHGYQQTRVSNEVRYLTVSGVIRAQDITRMNAVTYDKIADAKLAYVSNGDASSATDRKIGTKIIDRVVPF